MPEILETFEVSEGYDKNSLDSAKSKAISLRIELNGENPILAIIGSYGTISPSTILGEPYVLEREIPCRIETYTCQVERTKKHYPTNPDEYLKPFDIVKVKNKKGTTYFHFAVYLGRELYRYHLPIPFKKRDDTIRHIAKAVASHYKRGEYNLCNDNCEHYVWEQITGIDYSEQAIERPGGASFIDFFRLRGNHGVRY
nr:3131_t:CDS:2 [Entrophospora candida]